MKRILLIISAILLTVSLASCKGGSKAPEGEPTEPQEALTFPESTENSEAVEAEPQEAENSAEMKKESKFIISTTMGDMTVKLYDETPLHKANFEKLANNRFYDGILFHRIINGFMIQTGDPLTKDATQSDRWGNGGPGYTIPAEIVPGLTHKKGALAAARRGDKVNPAKESSGSQFYIVQDENGCKHLDGEYTVFGEVISGFDVIDKIASTSTDMRDRPLKEVKIISVRAVK
ncbi:MAG: peptidylprolyl isomerase [Bacteroidales bacterium]|nr:peptidylprolyl isomerase [Bacteroidales bacterium]